MAQYDTIIKGGTIVDGTRTPRYVSDIAIKDGKIAQIGGLKRSSADKVLDASGLIIAPGFVDLHTHYDAQIFWDPYCTLSGWHGVTTVLIGNCGFGFAPCRVEDQDRAMLTLTRNEAIPYDAMKAGMVWDWVTFPEFMDTLDRLPKGLNILTYVPLTPLYVWVMGTTAAKSRRPTKAELKEMGRLLNEAMDHGAHGWSAQVLGEISDQRDYDGTPMITDLMTMDELLFFGQVLADRDEGYIELSHLEVDSAANRLLESTFKYYERLAEVARRPILYQVVQAEANKPEIHRRHLEWLESCALRGLRIYGQGSTTATSHHFTFEDWNLYDRSPTWREVTVGSPAERKGKMQNAQLRAALREEWDSGLNPGLVNTTGVLPDLIVSEVGHSEFESYEGLTVADIAAREGKHVVDALLDLVVADDMKTEFTHASYSTDAEYAAEILKSPYVAPGVSDGGAHVKFITTGNFPTETLVWLVRDVGVLSLEEAHHHLSYLPAHFGGLKDRGAIVEGQAADIVVYDLEGLEVMPLEIAHDFPGGEWRRIQKAKGYRWILVNGRVTFEDGEPTGATPGKLLRHGKESGRE